MLTSDTLGTGGGAGSQVGLETCTDADAAKQAASSVQNRAGEDCCKHDMTTQAAWQQLAWELHSPAPQARHLGMVAER
jgi:hypothetical protein